MPNWSKTILTIRRSLQATTSRAVIGPRLAWSNDALGSKPYPEEARRERYRQFKLLEADVLMEPGALVGPVLPDFLAVHEDCRVGTFREGRELVSVHILRTAWVEPRHEVIAAVELYPNLAFEMVYSTHEDDLCGAMVAGSGHVFGHHEADLSVMEASRELLTQAERAEMPSYFVEWQWFMLVQAYRLAGLRPGPAVQPPRLDRTEVDEPPSFS